MRIARPYTEKYHNWEEGDCGKPREKHFKKGFWKRYDRKRWFKKALSETPEDIKSIGCWMWACDVYNDQMSEHFPYECDCDFCVDFPADKYKDLVINYHDTQH